MATTFQHRRGTTSQHSTFTGSVGEITVNTTKDVAVVHDGSTAGGFEMLRNNLSNLSIDGSSSSGNVIQSDGDGTFSYKSITEGKVLQLKSYTMTGPETFTSTSYTQSSLAVSITPSSTSSKVYVFGFANIGIVPAEGWEEFSMRLRRGSTDLSVGTHSGNQHTAQAGGLYGQGHHFHAVQSHTFAELDSPSTTSAITYNIAIRLSSSEYSNTVYLNRPGTPSTVYSGNGVSTITAIELAS